MPKSALKAPRKAGRVLFVMGGGGLPGIDLLAGMLQGLDECGVRATHIIGTSAGAIVGSLYAAGYSPDEIVRIVKGLDDRDVLHERPMWKLRLKWMKSWLKHEPVRDLLKKYLPAYTSFIPLTTSSAAESFRIYPLTP